MNGKGDKPRPYDKKRFEEGWDRVYGSRDAPRRSKRVNYDMDLPQPAKPKGPKRVEPLSAE